MSDLHLNVKGEYFDQIKSGEKVFEFRLASKWTKRLEGKTFTRIFIKRGYPKKGDVSRILERPWRGYMPMTIKHPHFGVAPAEVLAIRVNWGVGMDRNATYQELANDLRELHLSLEEKRSLKNDWSLARMLEDTIGAGQHTDAQIDQARELLKKHGR